MLLAMDGCTKIMPVQTSARHAPTPCRTYRYHDKMQGRLLYYYNDAIVMQEFEP